ncbi:beta-L-arabinofuranosidase domain-containing protein [Niabella beijingensis]|uniref:beta-L-arabinofuranosidase domain-containing protein n=1 Tax=Niabella beijingensis TaxID=2872700 RepID=UPI001CC195FF|nr:beta-L-arabinofuranosidase domain-containing protein [Niabella beijingensis]MBZ4191035.1 glycoside hydrolase family 127 protein [Niabella beijingensis]
MRLLKSYSILLLFLAPAAAAQEQPHLTEAIRYVPRVFTPFDIGAVKPEGWLMDQLKTVAANSTGHLDETHDKIKNDNGWLGGKGDGWEETPYWLDGAVPAAYLLNDAPLKEKVVKYINWTLDHQRPSGYFGPLTKYERETGKPVTVAVADKGEDWWPKMVMLKVLQQYYSATKDKRVVPFMLRYFRYQEAALKKAPLSKWTEWAVSRGSENMLVVQWLYSITKEPFLLKLAAMVRDQSLPWSSMFGGRDWVMNAAAFQNNKSWMTRHGVNVGMAIKEPALNYERTGNRKYIDILNTGWKDIMLLHGLPNGIFSADEDLHGNLPTQGTELCAIVETMFSMEEALSITGELQFADALERMTFNAFPPQTTADFNRKQYFQIANQVEVDRGVYDFSLPFDRQMNNVFGARSGYSCCLANMHQGWPKFVRNLWHRSGSNGIAALVYGPSELTTTIGSIPVTIAERTTYPFNDEILFEIKTGTAVVFPFLLRIPSWCQKPELWVNNEIQTPVTQQGLVTLHRTWKEGDVVRLRLPMTVQVSNWGRNSRAIERGPLVYALKLNEKAATGTEASEGMYETLTTTDPWNYGLLKKIVDDPSGLKVTVEPLKHNFRWVQDQAPVTITATGKRIPAWHAEKGRVADQPVSDREGIYKGTVAAGAYPLTLIPYGFTRLRIVAFPVVP